jgi:hypothetical protein
LFFCGCWFYVCSFATCGPWALFVAANNSVSFLSLMYVSIVSFGNPAVCNLVLMIFFLDSADASPPYLADGLSINSTLVVSMCDLTPSRLG